MLAEKLMGMKDFNIEEEMKNVELLKLRCGDNNLISCDIILKDVKDSKRVNDNIQSACQQQVLTSPLLLKNDLLDFNKLNCTFVSKGYWPINYDSEGF